MYVLLKVPSCTGTCCTQAWLCRSSRGDIVSPQSLQITSPLADALCFEHRPSCIALPPQEFGVEPSRIVCEEFYSVFIHASPD
jgi:hypothetical protein